MPGYVPYDKVDGTSGNLPRVAWPFEGHGGARAGSGATDRRGDGPADAAPGFVDAELRVSRGEIRLSTFALSGFAERRFARPRRIRAGERLRLRVER